MSTTETALSTSNPHKRALIAAQAQIKAVLPAHLNLNRMIQVATMAVYRNPKLQQCDPMSVVESVILAAELGLEPSGGVMGHGDLLPVWSGQKQRNVCQFRPRYGGLIQLARNTGEIKNIFAEVVYEGESFYYSIQDGEQRLGHTPEIERDRQSPVGLRCAYAICTLTSGERRVEVMSVADLEKVRASSETERAKKAGKFTGDTPWEIWYGEMAKKSVLKRLCKTLPKSVQLAQAIEADNSDYVEPLDMGEATVTRAESLKERLQAAAQKQVAAPGEIAGPGDDLIPEEYFDPATGEVFTPGEAQGNGKLFDDAAPAQHGDPDDQTKKKGRK